MPVLDYNDFWLADPDGAGFPDAPTVKLVDLNELEQGCVEGFGIVDEPQFAEDNQEAVLLGAYGTDGDYLAARRHGNGTLTFRLMYKHPSVDAVRAAVRLLGEALDRHGVLVYQLKGTADPLYFDFVPSQIPQFLRGGEKGLERLTRAIQSPQGLVVAISAHPFPRGERQTGTPEDLTNEAGNRHVLIVNPGNRPSEVQVRATPQDADARVAHVRYGIRSHGNLTEFLTLYSVNSADADAKVDTAVVTISSVDAMVTDFATNDAMTRRVRDVRTATDPTAIEGTFRLMARLRAHGGTAGTTRHRVQGRYGVTSQDVTPIVLRSVRLDWRDIASPDYVDVDLGLVQVPKGATTLALEFWAERLVGDQNLALQQLFLVPADEHQAIVAVPGFRLGAWGQTRYKADELAGTGELVADAFVLNENDEIARQKPTAGTQLSEGVHAVSAIVAIREPNDAEATIGKLEIVEDPTGADVTIKELALRNKQNRRITRRERTIYWAVSAADVIANKRYRFQVRQSSATANKRRIRVLELVHRFLETIGQDRTLVLDSMRREAYVENAGVPDFSAVHENELPRLKPGSSAIVFSFLDAPVDPGYDDADDREPLGRSILTRSVSVSVDVWPRYTH